MDIELYLISGFSLGFEWVESYKALVIDLTILRLMIFTEGTPEEDE